MGAWGPDIFENDDANDWAYGLDDSGDLSLVSETIDRVARHSGYLDAPDASEALASCEVVARCLGRPGKTDAYTEKVDEWIARVRPEPEEALRECALVVIDRVLADDSELAALWDEGGDGGEWRKAVTDLRGRLMQA